MCPPADSVAARVHTTWTALSAEYVLFRYENKPLRQLNNILAKCNWRFNSAIPKISTDCKNKWVINVPDAYVTFDQLNKCEATVPGYAYPRWLKNVTDALMDASVTSDFPSRLEAACKAIIEAYYRDSMEAVNSFLGMYELEKDYAPRPSLSDFAR